MKRSEMVLIISDKLQKQMHLINSKEQREHPKMLCDNLAMRVLATIEAEGMLAPLNENEYHYMDNEDRKLEYLFSEFHKWEEE